MFASKRNLILILIAATFLAYFSSFSNPFIWDDEQFITSNQYVQQFDIAKIFTTSTTAGAGVVSNYYRPLTTLSFAIDAKLWGSNPFGFHLTNFLFHLGAGLLLFGLLIELFGWVKPGAGVYPAFFISLIFLVHPIQTEAVTYINSRGDSMYTFFLFLSFYLFVCLLSSRAKSRDLNSKNQESRIKNKGEISHLRLAQVRNDKMIACGVMFFYLCSILSKEIAIAAFPLYFGIILYYNWGKKLSQSIQSYTLGKDLRFKIQDLRKKILWFAQDKNFLIAFFVAYGTLLISLAYFVLRLTILRFGNILNFYGFDNEYTRSLAIRLFTFCKVVWIYLGLLIWPYPLHMERSVDLVKSIFSPWVLSIGGLFILVVTIGIWELKKNKTAWILFGLLWFVVMLIPGSGIIPINGIVYEHWLYVPIVGVLLVGYGLWQIIGIVILKAVKNLKILRFTQDDISNVLNKILISFVTLLSILYIVLTIHQNQIWSDPVRFYQYTLSFAPTSARLHNNLGMTYANSGDAKDAIPEYQKALALGPGYPQIYNNLGNAQIATGDYQDAEKNLKKALEMSPEFEVAKLNLIKLYILTKQFAKAEALAGNNETLQQVIHQAQQE